MNPTPTTRSRSWPVLLLAAPAFVAIWSGWVGLGELTGFGPVKLLPGIWDGAVINSAITLPIGMETYAAYALHIMLSTQVSTRARRFARWSALGALILGAAGQVAYHLMSAAHLTHAPGPVTALVACLPVAVLGMGAALAHLVHDSQLENDPDKAGPTTGDTSGPDTGQELADSDRPDGLVGPGPDVDSTHPEQTTTDTQPTHGPRSASTGTSTAGRVARLRAERPDLTQKAIAAELGITERTVRRYLTAPPTTATTGPRDDTSRAA